MGQNKNVLKPVMLAVIAALIIGSLFGVIMLRMFVTMDGSPELGNNPNPAAVTADETAEENNDDTSVQDANTVEFEPVTANVLQGGIFSENENASAWALHFEELDIPVMIWNRDDQYYLFAGVKSTDEEASQAAEELETEELEIYSKEWSTPPLEISLNATEEEWLKSYLSWWNNALSSSEDTTTQLDQLKKSIPDGNERLKPLYDEIMNVNEINEKILLELWHVYESLNDESG